MIEGTRRWGWLKWVAAGFGVVVLGTIGAAEYVLHHLGPIVRTRVVETLSAKFHAPVELEDLQISLFRGIEVEGTGLRIPYGADDGAGAAGGVLKPMILVRAFSFRTSVEGLLHEPTHIAFVRVDGMELHVPSGEMRVQMPGVKAGVKEKIAFTAGEILATDVTLVVETSKPGKAPLTFAIPRLDLHDIGAGQPMVYDAQWINPKPTGQVHAVGRFGPWKAEAPCETPLEGDYTFDHADLSSIKGLGGMLSSKGHYAGLLDRIAIDGSTDTPEFSLESGSHPELLKTVFHAYVDATNGDTTLDPVQGRLGGSDIVARGKIAKIRGVGDESVGHDISLDVTVPHGRIEDMLELGMKTTPTIMRGALTMHAKLHIPPGNTRVAEKMQLAGTMQIAQVEFKPKWQDKVDGLSMRAQGKPEDAREASMDSGSMKSGAEVGSGMSLNFGLDHGTVLVDDLLYTVPGARVMMNGVYSADGRVFEFRGRVRTDATASQMVTGWKSILLMPFDKYLKKSGAGMELPVSISGTGGDIKFGLAMQGADDSAAQIQQQMGQSRGVKSK